MSTPLPPDHDETRLGHSDTGSGSSAATTMAHIGPYRVIGVLGEGGMGRVYEAEQASPRRRVALKVIRGALADDLQIRMFLREAETLGRLEHPNIGAIYESGRTADGQHYFAMELVRGRTLDAFLSARGALDAAELRFRLTLFGVIADAVHYAHQRGVIHRDLKPSNVIVADGNDSMTTSRRGTAVPTVKILDFGLARLADAEHATTATDVGVIKGTLAYMSPEQARGGAADVDVRSDVYALGVVLYEMLTGRRPYDTQRGSLLEAVRVICEDAPAPLSNAWPGPARLDPDIATIIGKALEKDPARRYASAAAMSEDVGRYLTAQPILARPPSTAYQLRRFAQRHRGLVGAVAAILAVIVAGAGVATWQAVRATHAEALASRRADDATAAQAVAERRRVEAEAARALADERRVEAETATAAAEAARRAESSARAVADARRQDAERATAEADAARARESAERQRADASAATARDEAAKSSAINDFLTNELLSSIMPSSEVGRGRDVAMKDVIDEASRRLGDAALTGGRFVGQPLVEAAIRLSIGRTYRVLGEYERAQPHLDRALALREQALGRSALPTQDIVSEVALLLNDRGRSADAEPLLREVLRARQTQNAPALDIARAKGNLGLALMDLRRYGDAEALLRDAERALDELSAPPELVFGVHNNLGVLFLSTSRPDLARETFAEAREALLKTVGPDAPATIMATGNLAAATRQLGRLDEAVKLMTDLLPTARRVAGDTHPAVLTGLINLAAAWNALGTPQRTIEALPDALAAARTSLGPAHPTTVLAMMALGEAYLNTRQPDKASQLLTDAVAGFRAAGTADTADGLLARTLLVRSSIGRRRAADAIEDMRRIVTRTEALKGADSLSAVLARQLLGFVLLAANETSAAAPLIQSTLAALGDFPDDPGARLGMIEGLRALSSVRSREGRFDEELQLLEQAVAKADAEGPNLRELANRLKAELANAYVTFRRAPEKTEPLLRAAIEGLGAVLGPSHPDAIAPLFDLWLLKRRTAPKRETGAIELMLAPRLRAAAETAEPSQDTLGRLSVLLRLAIAPGIRDLPASLRYAERATVAGSTNFTLWAALGEARLANKQRAGAAAAFERAIALLPPGPARAQLEGKLRELKR